jgi:hypothetical protein
MSSQEEQQPAEEEKEKGTLHQKQKDAKKVYIKRPPENTT